MKKLALGTLIGVQATTACLLWTGGTNAQETGKRVAPALEETVVTARKRAESLQDIPLSIDAFNREQIRQLDIRRTEDLANFTPALTFDVGALPNDTRPVIRGVNASRGRPNVAILVDFIDVSSEAMTVAGGGITANLRAMDLERIEVVKGSQSVLYGRSAFAGAINYITRRPSDEFEGRIGADYDEHDTYTTDLSVSGPLIEDTLTGRLTLAYYDTDGWYDNPNTGGDLGSGDSKGGSLALQWTPNEDLTAYLRGEYTKDKFSPRAEAFTRSMSPDFNPAINPFGTGSVTDAATQLPYDFNGTVCDALTREQPYFDSFGAGPACRPIVTGELDAGKKDIDLSPDPRSGRDFDGSDSKNTRVTLDVEYLLGEASVHYLGGYTHSDLGIQQDFDMSNYEILAFPQQFFSQFGLSAMSQQQVKTDQWSHELRISADQDRWHWMLSGLYWKEDMDVDFDDEWWLREGADEQLVLDLLNQFVFSYLPPPGMTYIATGPGNTPATPLKRDTEHWSVAASIGYDLTETLRLTAEGRYLDETIKYQGRAEDVSFYSLFGEDPNFGSFFGPGFNTSNKVSESKFLPRVTVDWEFTDEQMVYAYAAKGFKPGGVSTVDANGDVSTGEYESESIWTYELGYKSMWRDDSVRFNAAAFYYDYTDQQVPYFFTDPATGLLNSTVLNAGETEVKGVEMEVIWNSAFISGLSAQISYVYSDAEYSDFNTRKILAKAGGEPDDNSLALAGNVDGDYSHNQVLGSAEHSGLIGARYGRELGRSLDGYIEMFGRYESKRYVDLGNRAWLPSRWTADIFTGVTAESWDATLYVTNVFDNDDIASGVSNVDYGFLPDFQNVSSAANLVMPQPRTFGIRASYHF